MSDKFDQATYWKDRHRKLRGDSRATGNISRSSDEMLQRKLAQAYFFFALVHSLFGEARLGKNWLAKTKSDTPSVLDIGFGTGFLGSLFALSGVSYTGYDVSDIAVEDASLMSPHGRYVLRNIVDTPAEPSDIVIASEVLFHIVSDEQWLQALGNIATGLRPDSVMLFTETFVEKQGEHLEHFKPRTREMYDNALAKNGLRFVRPDETALSTMAVFDRYTPFKRSLHLVRLTS